MSILQKAQVIILRKIYCSVVLLTSAVEIHIVPLYNETILISAHKETNMAVPVHQQINSVLTILMCDGLTLRLLPLTLRNNFIAVFAAVSQNPHALEFASSDMKDNKRIVAIAVKQCGMVLRFASDGCKNDPDIVLLAINQNSNAFQFASDEQKSNIKIVRKAVSITGWSILHANPSFMQERSIVKRAIRRTPRLLQMIPELEQ